MGILLELTETNFRTLNKYYTENISKQRQLYDSIGVSRNDLSYKDFTFEWF